MPPQVTDFSQRLSPLRSMQPADSSAAWSQLQPGAPPPWVRPTTLGPSQMSFCPSPAPYLLFRPLPCPASGVVQIPGPSRASQLLPSQASPTGTAQAPGTSRTSLDAWPPTTATTTAVAPTAVAPTRSAPFEGWDFTVAATTTSTTVLSSHS